MGRFDISLNFAACDRMLRSRRSATRSVTVSVVRTRPGIDCTAPAMTLMAWFGILGRIADVRIDGLDAVVPQK